MVVCRESTQCLQPAGNGWIGGEFDPHIAMLLVTDGQAGLKSGLLPMISTDGMFNPGISVLKKSLRV